MREKKIILISLVFILLSACQKTPQTNLYEAFKSPPESAKPWVFWYWIKAAVSKEGITADLEAMQENGIGGAYLIPIQGAENPPIFEPSIEQFSPEWFEMVHSAFIGIVK